MGLDIQIRNKENTVISEMSESLHEFIFEHPQGYGNNKELRKIKDYYLTNALFKEKHLNQLINDISLIIAREDKNNTLIKELMTLTDLSDHQLRKIIASHNILDYSYYDELDNIIVNAQNGIEDLASKVSEGFKEATSDKNRDDFISTIQAGLDDFFGSLKSGKEK